MAFPDGRPYYGSGPGRMQEEYGADYDNFQRPPNANSNLQPRHTHQPQMYAPSPYQRANAHEQRNPHDLRPGPADMYASGPTNGPMYGSYGPSMGMPAWGSAMHPADPAPWAAYAPYGSGPLVAGPGYRHPPQVSFSQPPGQNQTDQSQNVATTGSKPESGEKVDHSDAASVASQGSDTSTASAKPDFGKLLATVIKKRDPKALIKLIQGGVQGKSAKAVFSGLLSSLFAFLTPFKGADGKSKLKDATLPMMVSALMAFLSGKDSKSFFALPLVSGMVMHQLIKSRRRSKDRKKALEQVEGGKGSSGKKKTDEDGSEFGDDQSVDAASSCTSSAPPSPGLPPADRPISRSVGSIDSAASRYSIHRPKQTEWEDVDPQENTAIIEPSAKRTKTPTPTAKPVKKTAKEKWGGTKVAAIKSSALVGALLLAAYMAMNTYQTIQKRKKSKAALASSDHDLDTPLQSPATPTLSHAAEKAKLQGKLIVAVILALATSLHTSNSLYSVVKNMKDLDKHESDRLVGKEKLEYKKHKLLEHLSGFAIAALGASSFKAQWQNLFQAGKAVVKHKKG